MDVLGRGSVNCPIYAGWYTVLEPELSWPVKGPITMEKGRHEGPILELPRVLTSAVLLRSHCWPSARPTPPVITRPQFHLITIERATQPENGFWPCSIKYKYMANFTTCTKDKNGWSGTYNPLRPEPENLLLDSNVNVNVVNFGLCNVLIDGNALQTSSVRRITPAWK